MNARRSCYAGARLVVLGLAGLIALAGGCKTTKARTEVMLEVDADPAVRARLATLKIVIGVSNDDGKSWEKRLTKFFGVEDVGSWKEFAWPARLGLVPDGDNTDRQFSVTVQALDERGELYVWQQAAAGFTRGRTTVLRVLLTAGCAVDVVDCGDPSCLGTTKCETCRDGDCVDVEVLDLPSFDPKMQGDAGMLEPATPPDSGEHDKPDASGNDRDAALDAGDAAPEDSGPEPEEAGPDSATDGGDMDAEVDGATSGPFRVVATTPTGAAPVQTDINGALTVTFSDSVDQATLSGSTVTVTMIDGGREVAGTVAASVRGVTFTPDEPWALAGAYSLNLSRDITSTQHQALKTFRLGFTVRDGTWSREAKFDGLGDPKLALSNDGYGVMEWANDISGGGTEIMVSLFNPNADWLPAVQLTTLGVSSSAAAINSKHHAAVVWSGVSAGQNATVFGNSATWTSSASVSPGNDTALFLSETDEVFFVASSTGTSSTLTGYQYTLGASSPASIAVGASTTSNAQSQVAVIAGIGQVIWVHTEGTNPPQIMAGVLGPAAGVPLSSATLAASEPRLCATRAQTSAIVVWQQGDPMVVNDFSIWASRMTTSSGWSGAVPLSTGTGAAQHPAVAIDDEGRAIATFVQGGALKSASFDGAGTWSAPVTLSATGAANVDPGVVVLAPNGNGFAVWTQDSAMGSNEVWAARYLASSGWTAASRARISDLEAGASSGVALAADATGRALAAWYQSNKTWVARFE